MPGSPLRRGPCHVDIGRLVSRWQGWQGAKLAGRLRGRQIMENRGQVQAAAMSATYRVIGNAAKLREAAAHFWQEYARDPETISGDYLSDLVAELTGHVDTLAGLVAELDRLRAELDAASLRGVH